GRAVVADGLTLDVGRGRPQVVPLEVDGGVQDQLDGAGVGDGLPGGGDREVGAGLLGDTDRLDAGPPDVLVLAEPCALGVGDLHRLREADTGRRYVNVVEPHDPTVASARH